MEAIFDVKMNLNCIYSVYNVYSDGIHLTPVPAQRSAAFVPPVGKGGQGGFNQTVRLITF